MTRYGFGDAAREIQDLYLSGKQAEAMAAIPDELIDKVALCRPAAKSSRSASTHYRDAGVGTLLVTPAAATQEDRLRMMQGPRRARCVTAAGLPAY